MNKSMLLTVLLVTAITASLVASSAVIFANSANADPGEKIKEKINEKMKKVADKIKEKTAHHGGGNRGGDGPD